MDQSCSFSDQLGSSFSLSTPPVSIISLVPSQTELLYELGLNDRVVGITKFCIHPDHWLKEKAIIGGTKNFNFEMIDSLKPDLIIGNKEENYKEGIEQLREKYLVWMSDINSLEGSLEMISLIGQLTQQEKRALEITEKIKTSFEGLINRPPLKILYLIWRKPWMAAGPETFIHAMLNRIGFVNCNVPPRYPELSNDDVKKLNPDVVFLSSEPYPFKEKHFDELQKIVPSAKLMLVDGEMFSWYGSRLIKAPQYFNSLVI